MRFGVWGVVALGLLAACSGSDEGSSSVDTSVAASATTTPETMSSTTASSAAPTPSTVIDDLEGFEFSVRTMLSELVRPSVSNDRIVVIVQDREAMDAVFDLGDVDHFQTIFETAGSPTIDEAEAEVGWNASDIAAYGTVESAPERFVAIVGPEAWSQEAVGVGSGVSTLGEGSDLERDIAGRTELRPLGQPVRLASEGGVLAASTSTTLTQQWIDGSAQRLAEDDRYAAVATAFDERGVFSVRFVDGTFDAERRLGDGSGEERPAGQEADVLITEAFDLVASGVLLRDGELGEAIAWVFADEASAVTAADQIVVAANADQAPSAPGLLDFSLPLSYDLVDIRAEGRAVVADVSYTDIGSPGDVNRLIDTGDVAFVHG